PRGPELEVSLPGRGDLAASPAVAGALLEGHGGLAVEIDARRPDEGEARVRDVEAPVPAGPHLVGADGYEDGGLAREAPQPAHAAPEGGHAAELAGVSGTRARRELADPRGEGARQPVQSHEGQVHRLG